MVKWSANAQRLTKLHTGIPLEGRRGTLHGRTRTLMAK